MHNPTLRTAILTTLVGIGTFGVPFPVLARHPSPLRAAGTTRTGAKAKEATATVKSLDNTAIDDSRRKHKAGPETLATVHVVAPRTSAALARLTQQYAPNLIDIRTGKQIHSLPDHTVAEAVRRIPGISLETDEGEGRYINIRGLDADLNSTTYAGVKLMPTNNASPFGGYRAVALDSIPAGFIGAVKVTKSNLPSQDAEALGGTIEVLTKTAPAHQGPFLQGNVGAGYEPLRGTPVSEFSLTGGGRFGPFSIVLTASGHTDSRGINDIEPAYFNDTAHPYQAVNVIEQRDYELHRRRHGYALELSYQPNEDNESYFRAFDAGYTERYERQFMDLVPDGNTTVSANGTLHDTLGAPGALSKSLRDEKETSRERFYMLGGKNTLNGLAGTTFDYHVAYVEGTYKKPFDYNSTFTYTPPSGATPTIAYNLNGPGHLPLYAVSGAPGYLNPANYTLSSLANGKQYNFDREMSYVINSTTPLEWGDFSDQSLQFGLSVERRHKRVTAQPYSFDSVPTLPLTRVSSRINEKFYKYYRNGVDIIPNALQSLFGYGASGAFDTFASQQQYLDAHEDINAAYAQYSGTFGKLGVLGGVRFEATRDRAGAFATGTDKAGNPFASPISTRNSYQNFFPSLQLRYAFASDLILRAAYSTTIGRPGFNQSNPALSINVGSGIVTTGNPSLRPTTANNFDFDIEKYLLHAGILSVGVFDKEFSNYIVPVETTQVLPNANQYVGGAIPVHVFTYKNVSHSYARGLELNWRRKFQGLPGWLNGLGAGFNYTWVDSHIEIRPGEYSTLPSTSKNTWNATLFYQRAGLDLNLAAYSVSADLFGIGTDVSSDIYNATRTSMDFGASYAFSKNGTVFFYARNLLNTPHAFYQGTSNRPIQREYYGRTYMAGVRFHL